MVPPLDARTALADVQQNNLESIFRGIPGDYSEFCYDKRCQLSAAGDVSVNPAGRLYRAAHSYTVRWGVGGNPTTLRPGNLSAFKGRAESSLYEHAYVVATFGVKPNAAYQAVRSRQ